MDAHIRLRKTAVYPMLSNIYRCYREAGFHFIYIKDYEGSDTLNIVSPDDIDIVNKESEVVRFIEKFEDIPESDYCKITEYLIDDLTLATNYNNSAYELLSRQ